MIKTNNNCQISPKVSFGILTDVQYADTDDVETIYGSHRYYRNSLNQVKKAVDSWQTYERETNTKLSFVLQLGDLIDGKAKSNPEEAVKQVLDELNKQFPVLENDSEKILHIWGNHEMYNFKRKNLAKTSLFTRRILKQTENLTEAANYYTYDINPDLVLICLDYYELSVIGHDPDNQHYIKAMNILKSVNKNSNLNDCSDLPEELIHMVAYNGGLNENQLEWLKNQLESCAQSNKKAIVCGHMPLLVEASHKKNLPLNHAEIKEVIWSFPRVCVAYLAGHAHCGGRFMDKNGVFHLTIPGIVEVKPEDSSYAICQVFDKKIVIELTTNKVERFEIDY